MSRLTASSTPRTCIRCHSLIDTTISSTKSIARSILYYKYHTTNTTRVIYTTQTSRPFQHTRSAPLSQKHTPISDPPDYTPDNTDDEHSDVAYRYSNAHNNTTDHTTPKLGRITHAISDSASQVIHNRYEQTRDIASYLKQQMQRNWYRTVGITLGTITLIGFGITVFREQVKDETAVQIADVAKRSLGSDSVQLQVNQLSQDVVRKLLADPSVRRDAIMFVQQFLQSPDTQQMLVQLCMSIIRDEQTVQQFTVLGKQLVDRLSIDQTVQDQMVKLLHKSINHPTNVENLGRLVRNVVQEDFTRETLLQSLKLAAHQTLQDESVQSHATEMMKKIVQDPQLQKQSGDAAWHAIKYAVGLAPKPHIPHNDIVHEIKHRSKSDADIINNNTTAQPNKQVTSSSSKLKDKSKSIKSGSSDDKDGKDGISISIDNFH